MSTSWSTFGGDLHLDLTGRRAAGTGLRAALEDALREAVQDGRLAPGTRLPSSRALGEDLGIARNTVVEAYGQLVGEGWLTSRQGSGTTVAMGVPRTGGWGRAAPRTAAGRGARPLPERRAARHDLSSGRPDLSLFPRTAWLAAARRALATAPHEVLGYGSPLGRPELREALAHYLARVRGVRTDPDRLLVCSGVTQGLGLLCAALRERGAGALAVEAYGLPPQLTVVRAAGLATVPLPLDDAGARVDLLDDRVGGVLLTPAHQFPTGAPLAADRRAAAVRWAREHDGYVIEDDYDGEFRYDRQPLGAMQALDPERVVYAGTAAKSLAPGLRLGWLALPDALVEPVAELKRRADIMSPVLDQLTLAELIASGTYDRHVRRCRLHYRRRRDRLVAALAEHAPHVRVTGIAAGLHAVLRLPEDGPPEAEFLARAAAAGVSLNGLSWHRAEGAAADQPPSLVIGYGTPAEHAFPAALAALCTLLRAD